jgi:hypothetical protein
MAGRQQTTCPVKPSIDAEILVTGSTPFDISPVEGVVISFAIEGLPQSLARNKLTEWQKESLLVSVLLAISTFFPS